MTLHTQTPARAAADPDRLVAGGWTLPTGAPGLVALTAKFESAVTGVLALMTGADPEGSPGPTWYPPVIPRALTDRAQYTEGFPHLLGVVHAQPAEDDAAGSAARRPIRPRPDPVSAEQTLTDAVLSPAACFSIYPELADRVLDRPRHFDIAGFCYRHEATSEPGRLRSFRQREFVLVGGEQEAVEFRDAWIARFEKLFEVMGLTVSIQSASDPFFGPGARWLRSSQVQQRLKYEFVMPVYDEDPGTAIGSANCHKDHLGQRFAIGWAPGGTAHSSCAAFGLERTVLALIHTHGDRMEDWPALG